MNAPEPREPNSEAEWELELAAFDAANNNDVPEWARKVVADLWAEICAREKWKINVVKRERAAFVFEDES